MDIVESTRAYERWMTKHLAVVRADLDYKHRRMRDSPFVFLRGTFYRWAQTWAARCGSAADAPVVSSVGDLHVENFGTWRDAEGRLVWGVNDFDEACSLPYTNDLIRVATSAVLASRRDHFDVTTRTICRAVLEGYAESLARGGRPFVLAERSRWLREIALGSARDPVAYWPKLDVLLTARQAIPRAVFQPTLPDPHFRYRIVRRVAGVGSLGRPRFVALGDWCGARVAREAKAVLPSAAQWAAQRRSARVNASTLLARAVRVPDPYLRIDGAWIVRRLAPDCSRIEVDDLPKRRDEERLLHAMGWEAANVHLASRVESVRADLARRPRRWLERAATTMADAVESDWREWVTRAGRDRGASRS